MPRDSAIPDFEQEAHVLGWVQEAIEEGDAFLKAQRGYNKAEECINQIMGDERELRPGSLSSASSNRFGKAAEDLVSLLTDIKPFWEYRTNNKRYEMQATNFGKRSTAWYTQRQIDMRVADLVSYAEVAGSSYAHLFYDPDIDDQNMMAEDPRDVLPVRPSGYESIQGAMAVVIRRGYPVNFLKRKHPSKAEFIKADRDGSSVSHLRNTRAAQILESLASPFRQRLFGKDPAREMPRIPTADYFTIYLKDNSTNRKSYSVPMGNFDQDGHPLDNWSYMVEPGDKMYPRGRQIVCVRGAVLKDGPNPYWHGLFPVPKLTLIPWPWSWLGKGMLWDLLPLQRSLAKVLRVIEDHVDQVARPGVIADKNSVPKSQLDRLDTRRAGWKMQQNPIAGKGIQVVNPPPLPAEIFGHRDWITNEMDYISGVRDMSQLMRLNQMPSAESMDKLMESMTASVRRRSRVIEAFMREFAMIAAYNFAQFDTLPKRFALLGADAITPEDFDYDPGTMIPDYFDSDYREDGTLDPIAEARGPLPRYKRAGEFMKQFTFHVAPASLLASSEVERKLLYLNLARAGVIDSQTLLETLDIPNVNQIMERVAKERAMGMGMIVSPTGRKSSGQQMPRMAVKES